MHCCSLQSSHATSEPIYVVKVSGMEPICFPRTAACVSGKFSHPGKDATWPSLPTCIPSKITQHSSTGSMLYAAPSYAKQTLQLGSLDQ